MRLLWDSFVLLPRILGCWGFFARAFLLGRLVELMKQHSNNPRKNSLIHEVGYNLFGDFITLVQTILKITLLSH